MITVLVAIVKFIEAGEANGLKAKTLKWYGAILIHYQRTFGDRVLSSITADIMRQYVITIRKSARSEVTAIDRIVALHAFWRWASAEYAVTNPMARIKRPQRPKPSVKAPTVQHVRALMKAIPKTGLGLRDLSMLMLVVDAGLRINEALNLRPDDIDFYHHQITIHRSKNDKTRVVPFTRDVEAILLRWFKYRVQNAEFVFCTRKGARLKYQGAREILRRLHVKAGLEIFFSWHKYRHFSAQQYRRQGGDIFDLQKILGHEEITTTVNHYGNFIPDELVDKHELLSAVNVLREQKGI